MNKTISTLILITGAYVSLLAEHSPSILSQQLIVKKLPKKYQISYGDSEAPIQITEYFSLSCPQCIKSFRKDFKVLKEKYIKTGKVHFTFHLNPADLLTLQALVCLEKLQEDEKIFFWEFLLKFLKDPSQGCHLMQVTMQFLNKPIPLLDQLDYLEHTPAFENAYQYLKEESSVHDIPTIEINDVIYDDFPHLKFIEKKISTYLSEDKNL